jgi:hypothetical protein
MKNLTPQFDFDDILIVPSVHTNITSRYKDIILPTPLPLFTAPMDTVVNLSNIDVFQNNGIMITLPRTVSYYNYCHYIHNHNTKAFISLGFDDIELIHRINHFNIFHKNAHILIDVANGHMDKVLDYAKLIKNHRSDIIIMVGNIANPETYEWYAESQCVDYIRLSIGSGNACLTTKQSGIGYGIASLIYETKQIKNEFIKYNPDKIAPYIVADGGMKNYSDIVKALALGADMVMVGSIFNKAFESCADNYLYGVKLNKKLAEIAFNNGFPLKKHFRGMSTKAAQIAMGKTMIKTSEGVVRYRKVEYHLDGWVKNFEHYLRNAMSYTNCKTLEEFIGKVEICLITKNAHDRFNK